MRLFVTSFAICGSALVASLINAQPAGKGRPITRDVARETALLNQVQIPDGFTATIFAAPPIAMYPVCLTATVQGAVFACVDPNLSLTATKGRGRVVRLVDDNGDGVADRYTVFAEMDSPRGLVFDGKTLYVMHPPTLSAYRDTTGDGVADVSEDIVTGLGFDLNFRGADHTTNGITLGIDGYIYVAVGDYGYRKAVGKDGTTISHHGGSVIRVRTDGSGLELFAQGTRNIYDLAIDPQLHVFTRDNTNDGDGWDIRLHYIPPGAHMGYPMYYKYFGNEHMQSLADYGGGSGTGGLFVHDPGFPKGFGDNLYTADWVTNQVTRHPLTAKGASFEARQEKFVSVPHPVDMSMDGQSNMFVASLYGGNFTYEGDTVGYIVRVSPNRTATPKAFDIAAANDVALRSQLGGPNLEYAIQAQREILRRGTKVGVVAGLDAMIMDKKQSADARVAAMFTLSQLVGDKARATLTLAAADPAIRGLAFRAMLDDKSKNAGITPAAFVKALTDTSKTVQVEAIAALVRLDAKSAAAAIVPLTGSSDATVAHIAVQAVVSLDGWMPALKALNGTTPAIRVGALRALERIHDTLVVASLFSQIAPDAMPNSPGGTIAIGDAAVHTDVLAAIARLYFQEAEWNGDWWGTRPNFVGPYFAAVPWAGTGRARAGLIVGLNAAKADRPAILAEYERNRVVPQGTMGVVLAAKDASTRNMLIGQLVGVTQVPVASTSTLTVMFEKGGANEKAAVANLIASQTSLTIAPATPAPPTTGNAPPPALPVNDFALKTARVAALDATLPDTTRAKLVTLISTLVGRTGLDASTGVLAQLNPAVTPAGTVAPPLEASWRRYVGDRKRLQELDYFVDLSHSGDANARTLAFAVLLQSVRGGRAAPAVNDKVQPVLTAAWASRSSAGDLARAVNIMRLDAAYTQQLEGYRARSGSPASGGKATPALDLASGSGTPGLAWQPLFNGRDLKDWDIKFAQHPLGENFRNTFRVEHGMLEVRYDQWPDFKGEFGHIFYKQAFSYYIVAAEYRFVGEQVTGAGAGNSWAIRNNGIMVHSQSAASMGLNQDFPISLEVQLLGGLGKGTRTNGNVCTPGTNIVMNDKLVTTHCINSNSITYDGDGWVRVEAMVLGDSVIKHIVNGDTVLTYFKPQMGGGNANNTNPGVLINGKMLTEGFITLQAESAPIDFRKVEIVNLMGCMDPKDANYKPYFVKSDPTACKKR
ncbi:MAG: family 16 glycoside hydrolase [Gemmatimonas sp.]